MPYTKQDIEEAIKCKYLIQDEEGDYCIPTRIDNRDVWGVWYKDSNLTIPYRVDLAIELSLDIKAVTKIYLDDDTTIEILFRKLGYE